MESHGSRASLQERIRNTGGAQEPAAAAVSVMMELRRGSAVSAQKSLIGDAREATHVGALVPSKAHRGTKRRLSRQTGSQDGASKYTAARVKKGTAPGRSKDRHVAILF